MGFTYAHTKWEEYSDLDLDVAVAFAGPFKLVAVFCDLLAPFLGRAVRIERRSIKRWKNRKKEVVHTLGVHMILHMFLKKGWIHRSNVNSMLSQLPTVLAHLYHESGRPWIFEFVKLRVSLSYLMKNRRFQLQYEGVPRMNIDISITHIGDDLV